MCCQTRTIKARKTAQFFLDLQGMLSMDQLNRLTTNQSNETQHWAMKKCKHTTMCKPELWWCSIDISVNIHTYIFWCLNDQCVQKVALMPNLPLATILAVTYETCPVLDNRLWLAGQMEIFLNGTDSRYICQSRQNSLDSCVIWVTNIQIKSILIPVRQTNSMSNSADQWMHWNIPHDTVFSILHQGKSPVCYFHQ